MNEQQVKILIELLENVEKEQNSMFTTLKDIQLKMENTKTMKSAEQDGLIPNEIITKLNEVINDNRQQDSRLHKSIVSSFREVLNENRSIENRSLNSGGIQKIIITFLIVGILFLAYQYYSLYKQNKENEQSIKMEIMHELHNTRENSIQKALKNYDSVIYQSIKNGNTKR